jgi:CIC family chloride channel protein
LESPQAAATGAERRLSRGLLPLGLLSLLGGAIAGLVGAAFRLTLLAGDRLRNDLLARAHGHPAGLLLVLGACGAAAGTAAWLVRRFSPQARGSGIPHVESVLEGEQPPAPPILIPVKFLGGALAIGSGLALGREGPTVQMGASIAELLGRKLERPPEDCRALLAAGAGAGLATAFNAPIGGAVFVLEELVREFEPRIAIAALGSSAGAIAVARLLTGDAPDFRVPPLPYPGFGALAIALVLGTLAGLLGVGYNRAVLGSLNLADRLRRIPVEWRAAAVGAAVGALAWLAPDLVGGGDPITQRLLDGSGTLLVVLGVLAVRFALGPVSYAAGTPGGLFAPILVVGAAIGRVFESLCRSAVPAAAFSPPALPIIAMAAFFTAVVRAPLTGIVLVIEMTGSFTQLLPMLGATFAAMAVPTLLGDPPIYASLRLRDSS